MSHGPPHADPGELARLLALRGGDGGLEGRLERLSAALLGRPYQAHPLIGGPDRTERPVTTLAGFDCVTYVETVWALATCAGAEDYAATLMALRYEQGRVEWIARNHYTSDWIARNGARGALRPVLAERTVAEPGPRRLDCLADYPPHEREMRYLPVERVGELPAAVRSGDLVGFVSTRPGLDTYHVGLLVRGEVVRVRHAARSAGVVTDEPLAAFLARNETPGLLLARLRDVPDR